MQHVPGPDFPTAGIINGAQEIVTAYKHRPRPPLDPRARAIRGSRPQGRQAIVVTELPYQVNKARLSSASPSWCATRLIDGIAGRCAMSPTRTACAWSSSSSAAK